MTNLNAQIQTLSAMRSDLYEQAGKVSISNPEQAKALWAAADALVKAMVALEQAEEMQPKDAGFTGDAFAELIA